MALSLSSLKSPSSILKMANTVLLTISLILFLCVYQGYALFLMTVIGMALSNLIIVLATYVSGGQEIQQTFYELIMNSYLAVMCLVASIIAWSNSSISGEIMALGFFLFFSFVVFAVDTYFSLITAGILESPFGNLRQSSTSAATMPAPTMPAGISNPAAPKK